VGKMADNGRDVPTAAREVHDEEDQQAEVSAKVAIKNGQKEPIKVNVVVEEDEEAPSALGMIERIGSALDSGLGEGKGQVANGPDGYQPGWNRRTFVLGGLFFLVAFGFITTYRAHYEHEVAAPRLAHVVQEYQGWRKPNIIAFVLTVVVGIGIAGSLTCYRHMRAERARALDNTFWGMVMASVVMTAMWVFQRKRARDRNALERAYRAAAKNRGYSREIGIAVTLILMAVYLVYHRRQAHLRHVNKRKRAKQPFVPPADSAVTFI